MKRRLAVALGLGLLALASAAPACQGKPIGHPSTKTEGPNAHTRRDMELNAEQEQLLDELVAEANAHPEDFEARKRSGLAHMNFTLAGVLRLQARAEADLEAAFALRQDDELLNRSLGRFYNMRAVAGDYSKAQMQVKVYRAMLGDRDPMKMSDDHFVAYSFFMLGQILAEKNKGNNLRALAKVNELEEQLAERVRRQPDNIEFHALAGNFSFFFAGNIPLDRQRRVEEAVAYFEVLRARWDELRPGAKDPTHCPNTYENFMFELAEGYMVLERDAEARELYEELAQIREPRTRGKELVAHVSAERLRNFDDYRGEMLLMPPWPSDVGNCVVCHAWSSEVPLTSLYSVEPIALEDVPSKAEYRPIQAMLNWTEEGEEGGEGEVRIGGRERLPAELAELIEAECSPCHFPRGEVVDMLDLSTATTVEKASEWIAKRVSAGDMPPDAPLGPEQKAVVRDWAEGLAE